MVVVVPGIILASFILSKDNPPGKGSGLFAL
jgi:hypothetical protein